ncbi:LipA and NB-ARC domain-containing protein [Fusarium austroafricanum]|uniref:LipA and NB-ARC domain-containing protein n=1 Tax=Fusarium austroafricanum TaxID=2364996 RepID=A0A8H4KPM9_9HYPO|nr:LipA and NB-ARC domain-containing protein [Fusarium austroafricanum]
MGKILPQLIFVHGLGGHRETSWTHKPSNVFWPKDLLSSEVPASRILSFGYDSGRGDSNAPASQSRIRNHAEDLVNDLNQKRELSQTTTRPIIFVAHSLGGLVVQDAIIQAKASADTDIRRIYEFSVAIAFIGTPHFGSELAKWETLRRDFRNILHSSNSEIVAVLMPDSEVLARIQADFHADLRDQNRSNRRQLEVFCFFEELGYGKLGLLQIKGYQQKPRGDDEIQTPNRCRLQIYLQPATDMGHENSGDKRAAAADTITDPFKIT